MSLSDPTIKFLSIRKKVNVMRIRILKACVIVFLTNVKHLF